MCLRRALTRAESRLLDAMHRRSNPMSDALYCRSGHVESEAQMLVLIAEAHSIHSVRF